MRKKTFVIPCSWEMYGKLRIEAASLEEAVHIAEDPHQGLPADSSYIDDSFRVDREALESYNPKKKRRRRG